MGDSEQTRYDSFQGFLREFLSERQKRKLPVDSWLGAVGSLLGATPLGALTRALGIPAGVGLSAGFVAALPLVGSLAGAAAGALLAKYLASARTQEGKDAAVLLQKAEHLYEEYLSSSLSDDQKKRLVDELLARMLDDRLP